MNAPADRGIGRLDIETVQVNEIGAVQLKYRPVGSGIGKSYHVAVAVKRNGVGSAGARNYRNYHGFVIRPGAGNHVKYRWAVYPAAFNRSHCRRNTLEIGSRSG